MTTEALYSANFKLWHPDRVQVQFTVRSDEPGFADKVSAEIAAILSRGYVAEEPLPQEGEKLQDVCGWVLGEYKDKDSGQFKPCVYLYAERLEFKIATVYPEKFEELPIVRQGKLCEGPAPTLDLARQKGYFNPAQFRIALVPQIDYGTGEPRRSEKGKVLYKFGRVVGASAPQPAEMQQPPSTSFESVPSNMDDVDELNPEDGDELFDIEDAETGLDPDNWNPAWTGKEHFQQANAWGMASGKFSHPRHHSAAWSKCFAQFSGSTDPAGFLAKWRRYVNDHEEVTA